jgi:hypothetical protein
MYAKISLHIGICCIFYAQTLEQSLTTNAGKIRMYSQYDILKSELWLKGNQRQHPSVTVHYTSCDITAHVLLVGCLQRDLAINFTV